MSVRDGELRDGSRIEEGEVYPEPCAYCGLHRPVTLTGRGRWLCDDCADSNGLGSMHRPQEGR